MAKIKYDMSKNVQLLLQGCIDSFERMKHGGIGIADQFVELACEKALKYINELEEKLETKIADYEKIIHCCDCEHLEVTGCYGECNGEHLGGIVNPNDYCSKGERRKSKNG